MMKYVFSFFKKEFIFYILKFQRFFIKLSVFYSFLIAHSFLLYHLSNNYYSDFRWTVVYIVMFLFFAFSFLNGFWNVREKLREKIVINDMSYPVDNKIIFLAYFVFDFLTIFLLFILIKFNVNAISKVVFISKYYYLKMILPCMLFISFGSFCATFNYNNSPSLKMYIKFAFFLFVLLYSLIIFKRLTRDMTFIRSFVVSCIDFGIFYIFLNLFSERVKKIV